MHTTGVSVFYLFIRQTYEKRNLPLAIYFHFSGIAGGNTGFIISVVQKKQVKAQYGVASFYHNKFNGKRTASGETFSQNKLTAACNRLPLGTKVRVTNLNNNRSVIVKVNDRLQRRSRRLIDLTRAAATWLNVPAKGTIRVKVMPVGSGRVSIKGK